MSCGVSSSETWYCAAFVRYFVEFQGFDDAFYQQGFKKILKADIDVNEK